MKGPVASLQRSKSRFVLLEWSGLHLKNSCLAFNIWFHSIHMHGLLSKSMASLHCSTDYFSLCRSLQFWLQQLTEQSRSIEVSFKLLQATTNSIHLLQLAKYFLFGFLMVVAVGKSSFQYKFWLLISVCLYYSLKTLIDYSDFFNLLGTLNLASIFCCNLLRFLYFNTFLAILY